MVVFRSVLRLAFACICLFGLTHADTATEAPYYPFNPGCKRSLDAEAESLLKVLKNYSLNIVTAESLTAGMISTTLVDVPTYGSYVYGGHAVYDSDAKREFLGVRQPDVYTDACARQMARGALDSGRAKVAIAVTGHAGPASSDVLGRVDIAVSIRTPLLPPNLHLQPDATSDSGSYATHSHRYFFCKGDGHQNTTDWCNKFFEEVKNSPNNRSSLKTLTETRYAIRVDTSFYAIKLAKQFVSEVCGQGYCDTIPLHEEGYDGMFVGCGEPSWIIQESLFKKVVPNHGQDRCDATRHVPYANIFATRHANAHCTDGDGRTRSLPLVIAFVGGMLVCGGLIWIYRFCKRYQTPTWGGPLSSGETPFMREHGDSKMLDDI